MAFKSTIERMRRSFYVRSAVGFVGFVMWLPVVMVANRYVAKIEVVNGGSMYPFMNEDKDSSLRRDLVFNYKFRPAEGLRRGMVVTLRSPTHPETIAIKRVIALEDDVVTTKAPYPVAKVKVPKYHVWLEGDGPPGSSLDSNTYGPVSTRLLTGKVTHILYPWRKLGAVKWWEWEEQNLKISDIPKR